MDIDEWYAANYLKPFEGHKVPNNVRNHLVMEASVKGNDKARQQHMARITGKPEKEIRVDGKRCEFSHRILYS